VNKYSVAGVSVDPPALGGSYVAGALGPISQQVSVTVSAGQFISATATAELQSPQSIDSSLQIRMCQSTSGSAGTWSTFTDEASLSTGGGSIYPPYGSPFTFVLSREGITTTTGTYFIALCAMQSGGGTTPDVGWTATASSAFGHSFTGQSKVVALLLQ
jgi:hypothetical protein